MSVYRQFVKSLGITAIGQILVSLGGIILLPLLTKSLGAGDYGLWIQVEATVSLLTLISGFGLPFALNRFLASEEEHSRVSDIFYSTVIFALASSVLLSILFLIFSPNLASLFFGGNINAVLLTASIAPIRMLWWTYLNYVRAFQEMGKYTIITVFQKYGVIVLSTILIFLGYGLIGALSTLVITYTTTLAALACLVGRRIGFRRPAFVRLKGYLRFSLPTVPGSISHWVVDLSNRYIIGALLGIVAVGYYSSAYVIGNLSIFLTTLLSLILPSALSKLHDMGKIHELRNHLAYSLKLILMVNIPFVFGSIALSKAILTVLSTAEIAYNAYFVAVIISLSGVFFGGYVVIAQILLLVKKTELIALVWGISALVNLVLTIMLVGFLGVVGAAIAALASYIISCVLTAYFSFREITFKIEGRFIAKCIISSLVMFGVISLFSPSGVIQTIFVILLGMGVYFLSMILLKGFKKEEIDFAKEIIKSLK